MSPTKPGLPFRWLEELISQKPFSRPGFDGVDIDKVHTNPKYFPKRVDKKPVSR